MTLGQNKNVTVARKNKSGEGDFIYFSQNPKKCMILTKDFRADTRTTRVMLQKTCWRHITHEFGLKSRKKWGGENREKNLGGATVTFYFFGSIPS